MFILLSFHDKKEREERRNVINFSLILEIQTPTGFQLTLIESWTVEIENNNNNKKDVVQELFIQFESSI